MSYKKRPLKQLESVGKLSLREKGRWWVAYYNVDGMHNALELSKIQMSLIERFPTAREQFMDMNKRLIEEILDDLGIKHPPNWEASRPAPPEEREH